MGVDAFFVLSGYLITGQLLRSDWRLRDFIWKRMARLWPALLVLCALVAALAAVGSGSIYWAATAATYTSSPALLISYGPPNDYLTHSWTLAVEMQFYVVWALIMLRVRHWPRQRIVALCASLAICSYLIRAAFVATSHITVALYASPARLDGLLLGSALAAAAVSMPARRWVIGGAGTATVVALPFAAANAGPSLLAASPLVILLTLALISEVAADGEGRIARILEWKPLRWLGEHSYSLYLWHWPMFQILGHHLPTAVWVNVLAQWLASFAMASLSYSFVERPARTWLNGLRRLQSGQGESKELSTKATLADVGRRATVDVRVISREELGVLDR